MSSKNRVRVGVAVLIIKDAKVLLGERKGSHGAGEYSCPGGHVEYGETMEQSLMREVAEECGVKIKNLKMLCVSDLLTYLPKHYVDIGFAAEWESGEPKVLEPDRVVSWRWYGLGNLPSKLFGGTDAYIEAYKTGKNYFPDPLHLTK